MKIWLRSLIAATALMSMVACSIFQSATPTQLQTDVETLADGVAGIVGALTSLPANLQPSADVMAQIQAEIATIKADSAQIAAAASPDAGTIKQISAAVGVVAALVAPFFPAAPTVGMVVQAALSLLPVILAAIGVTGASEGKFTPDEARLILRGAAEGGHP